MTKAELIEAVHEAHGDGMSRRAMAELIDSVFDQIGKAVKKNGRFVGAWTPKHYESQSKKVPLLNDAAASGAHMLPRERLREEMAKPQLGWFHWLRRPVLATALTVLMGVGIGVFFISDGSYSHKTTDDTLAVAEPGSAVSDLQSLEKNHDLYSDFEVLDDLDLQQNVTANPAE